MSSLAFVARPVGSVLVNVWSRGAARADVEAFEAQIGQLSEQTGAPVFVLMVIPERTGLPDDDARRLAGEMISRAPVERVVIVIEGSGFWAGAMRSVFVGLALVFKPGVPWAVKSDVAQGVEWLGVELPSARYEAAVDELRVSLGAVA